jgi:hypothetical protein
LRRVVLLTALLAVLGAASASAELSQKGDIFIRFDGGITPRSLPRTSLAPIGVRIEGTIRAPARQDPPALRKIRVALNRAGRLDTRGLPVCPEIRIRTVSSAEALAACGSALVGAGGITTVTSLPEQPNSPLRAELLLFNSIVDGRPAILGHIYQHSPIPNTKLVVFHISRSPGTFGTVLEATLPEAVNRNGYLKSIYLQLQRNFVFHGRRRSYLSASCAAPQGFSAATFPFARASMTFDGGRTLSSTLVRTCRVR